MRPTALLAALSLIGGCATTLRVPTEDDARHAAGQWPGTTLADLQGGRALYLSKCGTCHSLYLPAAFAPGVWGRYLDEMGPRAGVTEEERPPLERYLVTAAQQPQPTAK